LGATTWGVVALIKTAGRQTAWEGEKGKTSRDREKKKSGKRKSLHLVSRA